MIIKGTTDPIYWLTPRRNVSFFLAKLKTNLKLKEEMIKPYCLRVPPPPLECVPPRMVGLRRLVRTHKFIHLALFKQIPRSIVYLYFLKDLQCLETSIFTGLPVQSVAVGLISFNQLRDRFNLTGLIAELEAIQFILARKKSGS